MKQKRAIGTAFAFCLGVGGDAWVLRGGVPFTTRAVSREAGSDDHHKLVEDPLFSIPLPGSSTATLQIPGPRQARALTEMLLAEARNVGVPAAVDRALAVQLAAGGLAWDALVDGDLLAAAQDAVALAASAAASVAASAGLPLPPPPEPKPEPATTLAGPRLARRLLERLGPAYVKAGQLVASSPTLFPAALVDEFQVSRLSPSWHRRGKPHRSRGPALRSFAW